jgi:SAM-dependent methyltransferase
MTGLMVRWVLGLACLLAAATPCLAQSPDDAPQLGQPGRDVMWLPTHDALMQRMLEVAQIGPQDVVYDLGAGDGKIAIAAARQFGARAVGIEYNIQLAKLAERRVQEAGVADRVQIIQGDIFEEDFSRATVLTLYLLDELNQMLRPTVLRMKPGTRVVSNTFAMGDWEPDEVINIAPTVGRYQSRTGYYWVVPAQIAGAWQLEGLHAPDHKDALPRLDFVQRYQRVAGSLSLQGVTQPLLGVRLKGADLSFSFIDVQGELKWVRVRVEGEAMAGEMSGAYGEPETPVEPVALRAQRLRTRP